MASTAIFAMRLLHKADSAQLILVIDRKSVSMDHAHHALLLATAVMGVIPDAVVVIDIYFDFC